MKRITIHTPGNYHALHIEDANDPTPTENELIIDVDVVGVNYADCLVRMGLYASAKELVGYPITPGFEVAGRVAQLGTNVDQFKVGDRVMGITLFNAYASKVCVPANQVFAIPSGISLEQAAGIPCVFLTAWFALVELANVRHGERVLVHSAAGGVGGALVQLAKTAGCNVTAVVGSTHKIENAEKHGADAVIDKQSDNLWETAKRLSPNGFDIVLDANGVATLAESYAHLAPMGRLVVYGFHTMLPRSRGKPRWLKLAWHYFRTPRFDPLRMTKQNRSVLAFNLSFLSEKTDLLNEAMNKIIELLVTGRIHALRTTAFPFDEAALAHKALETGQTVGKLILTLHDS